MQTVQKTQKNIALAGAMVLSLFATQVTAGSDESQATPAQIQENTLWWKTISKPFKPVIWTQSVHLCRLISFGINRVRTSFRAFKMVQTRCLPLLAG